MIPSPSIQDYNQPNQVAFCNNPPLENYKNKNRNDEPDSFSFFRESTPNKKKESITLKYKNTLILSIGQQQVTFPYVLFEIVKDIQESSAMLDLKFDWDSSGAHVIPAKVWENAAMFLATYSKWIYENEQVVLQSPSINPVADGSIDLTWYTNTARMLINFKNSKNPEAHFYGDLQNDESIKGKFSIDGEVREYFAQWLRKNLYR